MTHDGCVPVQMFPQDPQFWIEFWRSTHIIEPPVDGQSVVPDEQPHVPELQTSLYRQLFPHVPQLRASVSRFVQTVMPFAVHCVSGAVHVHVPAVHDCPLGHACPHEPQLLELVCRSTQFPPHIVDVDGQVHVPDTHAPPPWH